MANETANGIAGAVSNLVETVGKLGQMQVEMIANGFKSASEVFEPLSKTSIELAGNVVNALIQVLQGVSTAIAPKK